MFDPSIPIYTVMVLSNFTTGINDGKFICGPLFLTINSKNFITLNWDFTCGSHLVPNMIKCHAMCNQKQIHENSAEIKGRPRGSYETNLTFPSDIKDFPGGWGMNRKAATTGSPCLPLVIESSRDGKIIDRRCMRIYPSWMRNFGHLRLGQLLIPGTHNSGAWTGAPDLISNYVLNQDRDLYQQLVFGQRYFDIRLGLHDDDFHITHNIIPTSKLETELRNIAAFAQKAPKEIIIIDVHKFNLPLHFGNKEHADALKLFKKILGKFMIPKQYAGKHVRGPKLSDLWKSGKNVIVAYQNREEVEKIPHLWPAIKRSWGDKITEKQLLEYIISEAKKNEKGNPMKVLMAELTPNGGYIMRNPSKSLGYLADLINPNLTYWLSDNQIANNFNIIATDFFLGNRLTEYAMEVNNKKRAEY